MKKRSQEKIPLCAGALRAMGAALVLTGMLQAQAGDFTLRGFAQTSFVWQEDKSSFGDLGLTPIFLWSSDRILVESELEVTALGTRGAELGLGYLVLNYDLTPNLRAQAGKLLLPFGIFGPRLHPSWIDKLPAPPVGFGHEDLSPTADLGASLRGVLPLGTYRFGYSAYVTNGPQLSTESTKQGMLQFGLQDNNDNKALGGRLELVRSAQSIWEIGLSGMFGEAGPDELQAMAILGALDFSYQRPSPILRGVVDLKSQGNWVQVNRKDYGSGTRFHNQSWNYVAQLAYRPTMANQQWIRNLEAVGRFAQLQYPHEAPWTQEGTEWAVGMNYWLNWNALVKVAWIGGGAEGGAAGGHGGHGAVAGAEADGGHVDGKLAIQMAVGL